MLVVPVHIIDLHASVWARARSARVHVDSTMIYRVGPTTGSPFFDLRQRIDRCWIDGVPVDPSAVAHEPVGGFADGVRVVRRRHSADSVHHLRVVYRLDKPMSDLSGAYPPRVSWTGPRLHWSFGMADLYAGRYLEMWFPSNLPFDQFRFTLNLHITGTPVHHTAITNGRAIVRAVNHWSIRFPSWFTTLSPLLEVHAADTVEVAAATVRLPISRRPVIVTAAKPVSRPEVLTAGIERISAVLAEQERRFGTFIGDAFTCFFHGAAGGMEYAHATTTSIAALPHEVIHSWFARGVMPATAADGWWDEAFTRYLELGEGPEPLDFRSDPIELCSRQPFQRTTSPLSYVAGSRVFRGIAALIGPGRLIEVMGEFFNVYRGATATTATLEAFLVRTTGEGALVDVFHRFVYGFDGAAPPSHRLSASSPALPPHPVVQVHSGNALWGNGAHPPGQFG
ncbi:hypothetical protein [Millisia brevis]|uniref:hypothetical protein n=1 Tax=Millisia brevis TaxID=264148 RepID=UPI0012ED51BD|nr:hypothetical protein [Millisia brevis]